MHELCPGTELYVPAGHCAKLVLPVPAQNAPAGQGVHAPAFAVAPYVPAGQLLQ